MTLVIAPRARDDLEEVWIVVAGGSGVDAADRWIDRIHDRCRDLLVDPLGGRARDDLAPGLRSVVVRPWVVFYRTTEDRVEIVRVLHGRRDVGSIL